MLIDKRIIKLNKVYKILCEKTAVHELYLHTYI